MTYLYASASRNFHLKKYDNLVVDIVNVLISWYGSGYTGQGVAWGQFECICRELGRN